jgi:amino acid permease
MDLQVKIILITIFLVFLMVLLEVFVGEFNFKAGKIIKFIGFVIIILSLIIHPIWFICKLCDG